MERQKALIELLADWSASPGGRTRARASLTVSGLKTSFISHDLPEGPGSGFGSPRSPIEVLHERPRARSNSGTASAAISRKVARPIPVPRSPALSTLGMATTTSERLAHGTMEPWNSWMERLAATRWRSAHALDKPSTALLLMPDSREPAGHLQRAAFGREDGLCIRTSLFDSTALCNDRAD